jgi:uncharacterized protein (TIGR03437 family)
VELNSLAADLKKSAARNAHSRSVRIHTKMTRSLSLIAVATLANAAALVPISSPNISLPVAGLEANQGQAKPGILFLARGSFSSAVTAQSILLSPTGAQQNFVASNPNPTLRLSDPLPGVANTFTGSDPSKWVTGIHRYATAVLAGIYPGVDAEYFMSANGQLTLRLILQPGTDPGTITLEIPTAFHINPGPGGGLIVSLGQSLHYGPTILYPSPVATQQSASGPVNITASFKILSTTRFGLQVSGQSGNGALQIDIQPVGTGAPAPGFGQTLYAADNAGNTFAAATVGDPAGKDDPFPTTYGAGCGAEADGTLIACGDIAVFKFSKTGDLVFVSYLSGRTTEQFNFLGLAPDGAVVVTGTTDSSDFPVSTGALQTAYAGPPAAPFAGIYAGDFFASRLDANIGALLQSTYLGGPNGDIAGETVLGADGSVYFLPAFLSGQQSAGMPVTPGALQPICAGNSCGSYAAHLAPSLDKLLYGAYLPGDVEATARLYSDGSVYFAGSASAGFPTTPGAYQTKPAGGVDGTVGRLDPSGSKLVFGTYVGGADFDVILNIAVSPNGSVWAAVESSNQNGVDTGFRLVHLDANGQRLLADLPLVIDALYVDQAANLIALAEGNFTVSQRALVANPCGPSPYAYLRLGPAGQQLFATYLPYEPAITGLSARGLPILQFAGQSYEIDESQPNSVFAGCVVDAASFGNGDNVSPGEIVTLFGSGLGPQQGVAYQLQNGQLPTSLGGTRVLVNGQATPLLYSSYAQVNAILPYSLPVGPSPTIQVETNAVGNQLSNSYTATANIAVFRSSGTFAAALNEDGTVNSSANPAKAGSRVVLFATGGGQTTPASTAGEVTPLETRPLQNNVTVAIRTAVGNFVPLSVEYAGAAPGLVSGATQINIKLPDVIPPVSGSPTGVLPLYVGRDNVTIAVATQTN